ncbi:hypothetical protein CHELA17_61501 [Chelatococcus asaccharovorans]|nr:hypothetical protein CHELA17_61501 [Chelatococcus asaccharovorans]
MHRPLPSPSETDACGAAKPRAIGGTPLEHFRVSPNRENAPCLCFSAFSSREPVSTSLENALVLQLRILRICDSLPD